MSEPVSAAQIPAPPRVVAIAGLVFSGLYATILILVRLSVPANPGEPGAWLADPGARHLVGIALNLGPFAGIAFLWYMAVLRSRIGMLEDRFFATVFLGSGMLFVSMLFVQIVVSRGIFEGFSTGLQRPEELALYHFARGIVYGAMNTFGIKMAAVFMFVTSTIGLRTRVLARWVSVLGYVLGLVLLLAITDFAWIALLFPLWVLVVSLYIFATPTPPPVPPAS